jgi:NADH:ubiquinone oxidoreductase subunit E
MGSSCFARGNATNLELIETSIKEKKLDACIELRGSRCEDKCSDGPNIEINGRLYNHLDSGSLTDILNELYPGKAAPDIPAEKKQDNDYGS